MTLVLAFAVIAIIATIKWNSFDDAQEQINELRAVVQTDIECSMLDNAQLALDMGSPAAAHQQLERINAYLKENR